VTGTKTGRDGTPGRQTDTLTLKERLRNVRRRKQAYEGLAARLSAGQPPTEEWQEKRDD